MRWRGAQWASVRWRDQDWSGPRFESVRWREAAWTGARWSDDGFADGAAPRSRGRGRS